MGIKYSENRIASLEVKAAHLDNILNRHEAYLAMIDWSSMSRESIKGSECYVESMRFDLWDIRAEINHHEEHLCNAELW